MPSCNQRSMVMQNDLHFRSAFSVHSNSVILSYGFALLITVYHAVMCREIYDTTVCRYHSIDVSK